VFAFPPTVLYAPNRTNPRNKTHYQEHKMRSAVNAIATERTLHRLSVTANQNFLDLVEAGQLASNGEVPTKNMCFKCLPPFAEEIDEVCVILGVSKRMFLQACAEDGVRIARRIMEAEGLMDELGTEKQTEIMGGF
jgi:hypothetical protein